jgi:4-carboxymuconolactone decarboxylase
MRERHHRQDTGHLESNSGLVFLGDNTHHPAKPRMTSDHPNFDKGLTTRTQVMGQDFVDKALGGATDFTQPMQEHITAKAWGDVWQRPGLELKTRSMITVAMLIAMGKQHELKGHVRGALNNGVTPAELQEILLHAAVYCGVPSAVEAFRTAAEVVDGPQRQA